MTTIREVLSSAKQQLIDAEIESYSIDADLMLCKAANLTKEKIIGYPEHTLKPAEIDIFKEFLARRLKREPISHILGSREFWGMDFKVTQHTLAPRADSETLIQAAIDYFKNKTPPKNIIDFGTGTGCLILSLLSEFKQATGTAIDISEEAIKVAKENSSKLKLANRCNFVVNSWGAGIKENFDLIISNPPYIKNADSKVLDPEVAVYEPDNALYGGDDGLQCYLELAPYIHSLLSDDGIAIVEFGINQHNDVKQILEKNELKFISFKKDLAQIIRCIVVCK